MSWGGSLNEGYQFGLYIVVPQFIWHCCRVDMSVSVSVDVVRIILAVDYRYMSYPR